MSIIANMPIDSPPPAGLAAGPAPSPLSDRILAFVRTRRQASMQHYMGIYGQIQLWYNAFAGFPGTEAANFRNNLGLPLIFSVVMSDVARKANSIFSTWPYVSFRGFKPGEEMVARKCEQLVSAQLLDSQSFKKSIDFFIMADLYGTAIAQVGWTHIQRARKLRQKTLNGYVPQIVMVEEFNGPDWEVVDPLYFRPQPYKKFIEEMDYCMREYVKDLDWLDEMNTSTDGSGEPINVFNPEAIATLKKNQAGGAGALPNIPFPRIPAFLMHVPNVKPDPYAKPVEIWEYWGDVPSELAPDGIRSRAITIANGSSGGVVLRNDPLADIFWHGKKPFISYSPMPDPHSFFGIGKARIAEPLQSTAARLSNQKLDAIDLVVNPMWFVNMQALSGNNLYTKPGRVIPVRGNPGDVMEAVHPDLQGLSSAYSEIEVLWKYIQQASGITEDTVMGMNTSGRQTAREYLGRQEQVLTRLSLEAMLASSQFVEPLAEMYRDLNKQYLPLPYQMKIIGNAALTDPITGMPIPMDDYNVDEGVINQDWSARAVGPLMMLTKTVQQQNAMQLLQIMGTNPVLVQATNWIAFAKKIYDLFDWPSDEMMVQQIPAVNQLAAQAGMSPEQLLQASQNPAMAPMGGAGGQQLDLLNPEMIGNQPAAPLGTGP